MPLVMAHLLPLTRNNGVALVYSPGGVQYPLFCVCQLVRDKASSLTVMVLRLTLLPATYNKGQRAERQLSLTHDITT